MDLQGLQRKIVLGYNIKVSRRIKVCELGNDENLAVSVVINNKTETYVDEKIDLVLADSNLVYLKLNLEISSFCEDSSGVIVD